MPFDPGGAIESIQRSLGLVPAAILAILFLAGPTLAWLLYRFWVRPRTSRYSERSDDLLWLCGRCRSANSARSRRCYRCGLAPSEVDGELQIVDGDAIVALRSDGTPVMEGEPPPAEPAYTPVAPPLVAVGPGRAPTFPRADISGSLPPTDGVVPSLLASAEATGQAASAAVAPAAAATNGAQAPRKVTTAQRRTGRVPAAPAASADDSTASTNGNGTASTNGNGTSSGHGDGNGAAAKPLVGVGPGPAAESAPASAPEPVATARKPRRPRVGARSAAASAKATAVVEPPSEGA